MDNYNYPMGADTPDAPWNQCDPDEKEFDVCISQTLSKSTSVNTSDYTIESNYLDADEGGGYVDEIITRETDWNKAYNEEHHTPLELIGLLKDLCEDWLNDYLKEQKQYKEGSKDYMKCQKAIKKYKYLIEECSDWVEDETEVTEE